MITMSIQYNFNSVAVKITDLVSRDQEHLQNYLELLFSCVV